MLVLSYSRVVLLWCRSFDFESLGWPSLLTLFDHAFGHDESLLRIAIGLGVRARRKSRLSVRSGDKQESWLCTVIALSKASPVISTEVIDTLCEQQREGGILLEGMSRGASFCRFHR